jgi:hypothetical protein
MLVSIVGRLDARWLQEDWVASLVGWFSSVWYQFREDKYYRNAKFICDRNFMLMHNCQFFGVGISQWVCQERSTVVVVSLKLLLKRRTSATKNYAH